MSRVTSDESRPKRITTATFKITDADNIARPELSAHVQAKRAAEGLSSNNHAATTVPSKKRKGGDTGSTPSVEPSQSSGPKVPTSEVPSTKKGHIIQLVPVDAT
jgi:hypothetical protein